MPQQIINRNSNGQFGRGNNANPLGSRGKALSSVSNEVLKIIQETTKEEWPAMIKKIISVVKNDGNVSAFKVLCEYVIGKPAETININDDSDYDSIPQFATKEARARAMEILKNSMAEIQNISEEQDGSN